MKRLTYEAGVYSAVYIFIGVFGLITLFFDPFLSGPLIKDPVESIVLILIAIIYFRGFLKLISQDKSGIAFIFVAAIMGLLLGGLTLLNFVINGLFKGIIETLSYSEILNQITDYCSLSVIIGSLSFIPYKDIQSIEGKEVET